MNKFLVGPHDEEKVCWVQSWGPLFYYMNERYIKINQNGINTGYVDICIIFLVSMFNILCLQWYTQFGPNSKTLVKFTRIYLFGLHNIFLGINMKINNY